VKYVNSRRRFLSQLCVGSLLFSGKFSVAQGDHGAPFTKVPTEYEKQLASLRSPRLFRDGSPVKSPNDWQLRRREILADWTRITGSWPALVEKPIVDVLEIVARDNIEQRRVRVQIAPDRYGDGYVLVPKRLGPFPAVFVPYYDAETSIGLSKNPFRDFAWQLAKRGFVSLAIGSPGGDARKPILSEGAECQPLSYLGYIAANAWNTLANMPEVDSKRIGIVGHSYGGKWAMFGSCLWEKYACAVWSDPGIVFDEKRESINYQEPWYLGFDPQTTRKPGLVREDSPRTGSYKRLIEAGNDLHELHSLMAPRPFLVSGGEEDPPSRWAVLNHSVQVNELLGVKDRVAMTNRKAHTPTEESNEEIYQFFEYWLSAFGH